MKACLNFWLLGGSDFRLIRFDTCELLDSLNEKISAYTSPHTTTTTTGGKTDEESKAIQEAAPERLPEFNEFLRTAPPNSQLNVRKLHRYNGTAWALILEDVTLYCPNEGCERVQNFANTDDTVIFRPERMFTFLTYQCRNCRKSHKIYAVYLTRAESGIGTAIKFGEQPSFGSHTPARLISLIGPDRELFLKGRRAENLGLGLGAFAYYRRVVEHQKDRIISEIRKVAVKVGLGSEILEALDNAVKETRFTESIDIAKKGIPQGLLINGYNPLTLLHDALSKGLHVYEDDVCLALAQSIRVVLAELADRMTQLLRDDAELTEAVNQLRAKPSPA